VAGSLVAYLDATRGRERIVSLLSATTNEQILAALGTTEESLLADWRRWMNPSQAGSLGSDKG
jgi:hypothetical protein